MVSDRRGKGWTSGQNDGSNAVPWRRFLERSRQATIAPSLRDVSQRAMRKGGTTKKFANQFRKHHAYLRSWPWSNSLDAVTQGRIIGKSGGELPSGFWQIFRWQPHPELAAHVRRYYGYFESSSRLVRRRELPSGEVALIISLGPHYQLVDPANGDSLGTLRTFVAGLDDTYSLVDSRIPGAAIQVDFSPLGGRRLLQLPMHLVSKRTTELNELFGNEADRLIEALFEAPDWQSRFVTLDNFLLSKLRRSKKPADEIHWAWRQLDLSRGAIPIQQITGRLGWTRKRLVKTFRNEIGIPPKALARVLRFRRALEELNSRKIISNPQLAAECGYSDQAHMIRDFKDFSGLTPVELLRLYSPEAGTIEV